MPITNDCNLVIVYKRQVFSLLGGGRALGNFSHTSAILCQYLDSGTGHALNCAIWQILGLLFPLADTGLTVSFDLRRQNAIIPLTDCFEFIGCRFTIPTRPILVEHLLWLFVPFCSEMI